jgi:hypothetical protein
MHHLLSNNSVHLLTCKGKKQLIVTIKSFEIDLASGQHSRSHLEPLSIMCHPVGQIALQAEKDIKSDQIYYHYCIVVKSD